MHKEASLIRTGEILTQGFFPDSVSTALTFVFGHGKQQNLNSSCNWSNFGEIWQKSRKSDEYKLSSSKRDISVVEGNTISTDIEEISRSCFDSTVKKMRSASSPIKDGFVYKRRKMQRNTVTLLSGENAADVTEENAVSEFNLSSSDEQLAVHEDSSDDVQAAVYPSSDCQDSERPSFSGRQLCDVHTSLDSQLIDNKNLESIKTCTKNDHGSARDVSHSAEGFTNKLCCSTENCSATNGSTKSCVPCASILTAAGEHSEDCSTSGATFLESLEKFESPEEMCIYVLRRHGLLGESSRKSTCVSTTFVGPLFSPCKICGISESALRMLICDDCEEAFHLSCCRPKVKRLPRDEWYCQSCFIKKRKHLLRKNMGASSDLEYALVRIFKLTFQIGLAHPLIVMIILLSPRGWIMLTIVTLRVGIGASHLNHVQLVIGCNAKMKMTMEIYVASGGGHHLFTFKLKIGIVHALFFGIQYMLTVLCLRS